MLIAERQKMQMRRSFGNKYGFTTDSVTIELIAPVKGNVAIQGSKILIEVDFRHVPTRFRETMRFIFDPSDLRKMPYPEPKQVTHSDIEGRIYKEAYSAK